MIYIKLLIVFLSTGISAYTDAKYLKIKNCVTIPTAILGILLSFFDSDLSVIDSLIGFVIPFVICLVFYIFKMLRAGDVKLFMCIGAVVGWKEIVNIMAISMIIGGIIAIVIMIKNRCVVSRFKRLFEYIKNIFFSGMVFDYMSDNDKNAIMPLGICILLGSMANFILKLNDIHILL